MGSVAARRMTAEEFYDWVHRPENEAREFELERGDVVEVTRPGELHGLVCANIAWILGGYVRQVKRGRVCSNDMGLIMERGPDTVLGPDVVLYLDGKKFEELNRKYPEQMPVLIVEVLSPNDRMAKLLKRTRFLKNGV